MALPGRAPASQCNPFTSFYASDDSVDCLAHWAMSRDVMVEIPLVGCDHLGPLLVVQMIA